MGKEALEFMAGECPNCGGPVRNVDTRYGLRSSCEPCALHSWDGKELVTQAVHDARQAAHAAFDPIWKHPESAYPDWETMSSRARKKVRRAMRNRVYLMLSELTGIPEPECHMSVQTDLAKLAILEWHAQRLTPEQVRDWWKSREAT